jgi:hypothetical protein
METLRNALGFFEENGQIVVKKTKSGRQEAAVTLHPDWIPRYIVLACRLSIDVCRKAHSQRKVNYGISSKESPSHAEKERIGIIPVDKVLFYRRDNPTVSRRVLEIADWLGQSLEKQSASLEVVLKGGAGDVFTTKSVKLAPRGRRETRL